MLANVRPLSRAQLAPTEENLRLAFGPLTWKIMVQTKKRNTINHPHPKNQIASGSKVVSTYL